MASRVGLTPRQQIARHKAAQEHIVPKNKVPPGRAAFVKCEICGGDRWVFSYIGAVPVCEKEECRQPIEAARRLSTYG